MVSSNEIVNLKSVEKNCGNLNFNNMYFSVDNREVDEKSIFIAIVGDKYNPLEHIDKLLETGCQFIVVENKEVNLAKISKYSEKLSWVLVSDITLFIQEAGALVAKKFQEKGGNLIGIAGSNGKTTTKNMLNHIFSTILGEKNVISTIKNYNNHIGVPFTLFQIRERTKIGIVELGSNHPGEMKIICDILRPNYGLSTNIGDTHLEFFGTRENVFLEESYLINVTQKQFFINDDDQLLSTINNSKKSKRFGKSSHLVLEATGQNVSVDNSKIYNSKVTGIHNFQNLGVAFLICNEILPTHRTEIIEACESFSPSENRSQWLKVKNTEVFLDAYNANPSSMEASLAGFKNEVELRGSSAADCAVILGDMNELGVSASSLHQRTGKFVESNGFKSIYYVGRYAQDYRNSREVNIHIYSGVAQLKKEMKKIISTHKYLFIKGSRSLQLEHLVGIN